MNIGRRIYFDKADGSVIAEMSERKYSVVQKTVEQEIEDFKVLKDRTRESFDFIELEYGQYMQDFLECIHYRVNPATKELEFSYPDPNEPETPPVYQKPLSVEVEELRQENVLNMLVMTDMFEENLRLKEDNTNTMVALTEMYELMMGGSV